MCRRRLDQPDRKDNFENNYKNRPAAVDRLPDNGNIDDDGDDDEKHLCRVSGKIDSHSVDDDKDVQ